MAGSEAWVSDTYTLFLGSDSFVALIVAGLITPARGHWGGFREMADWESYQSQG